MREEVRLWKIWPSRNKIFLDGLCITGPQVSMLGVTFLLVCLPTLLWRIVAYDYLFLYTTPALPRLTISCFVLSLALLLRVSCSDPGILPRRDVAKALRPEVPEGPELERLVDPFANTGGAKWCPTCRVHRPLRASHCQECDNCVLHFDHHCHLLNNCIGQRNYLSFIAFLIALATLGVLVLVGFSLFWTGAAVATDPDTQLPDNAPLLFLTLGSGVLVASLLALLCCLLLYHCYLIAKQKTTKEHFREARGRPMIQSPSRRLQVGSASLFNLRQLVPSFGCDSGGLYMPVDQHETENTALLE